MVPEQHINRGTIMKVLGLLGITVLVGILILYEWPKMKQNQQKEKKLFLAFLIFDWVFAIVFLFYPDLPNPLVSLIPIFEWIKP
jgi:uncharacterized membrane protein